QGLRVSGYILLHLPVLGLRQLGKLSNKGNDVPYFVILERLAVGRHAGHFDPVLDDPEQLGVGPPLDGIAQIRRLRIEALADIPRILLRCTVAVNAGVSIDAESVTRSLIGELKGSGYLWRMTLYGMMHRRGQEPLKDSGFRRASRNVIDARIGEHHRANRQNDQGDYETQDEFHFFAPDSPTRTTCPIAPETLGWERSFRHKVEFICLKTFKSAMYA